VFRPFVEVRGCYLVVDEFDVRRGFPFLASMLLLFACTRVRTTHIHWRLSRCYLAYSSGLVARVWPHYCWYPVGCHYVSSCWITPVAHCPKPYTAERSRPPDLLASVQWKGFYSLFDSRYVVGPRLRYLVYPDLLLIPFGGLSAITGPL
jgi:hypothetical protein